ncbi:unnamed protein product [Parnassius apollo]|uniref:(apollo) hypothetical protein n=1 Tax=Parnassius apollo TaxID=110799 RepID=A0A8S3VZW5_PARAO|nr:unnamed protein product [Parnassius apollo]
MPAQREHYLLYRRLLRQRPHRAQSGRRARTHQRSVETPPLTCRMMPAQRERYLLYRRLLRQRPHRAVSGRRAVDPSEVSGDSTSHPQDDAGAAGTLSVVPSAAPAATSPRSVGTPCLDPSEVSGDSTSQPQNYAVAVESIVCCTDRLCLSQFKERR